MRCESLKIWFSGHIKCVRISRRIPFSPGQRESRPNAVRDSGVWRGGGLAGGGPVYRTMSCMRDGCEDQRTNQPFFSFVFFFTGKNLAPMYVERRKKKEKLVFKDGGDGSPDILRCISRRPESMSR